MAFTIKQGDTLPNLYFQIFQPDKVTPLNLTTASSIAIAVRDSASLSPLFKKACTISNASQGIGFYDWATGDTATAGNFSYEFEISWAGGDIQTVPVDGYFQLIIVDDIA